MYILGFKILQLIKIKAVFCSMCQTTCTVLVSRHTSGTQQSHLLHADHRLLRIIGISESMKSKSKYPFGFPNHCSQIGIILVTREKQTSVFIAQSPNIFLVDLIFNFSLLKKGEKHVEGLDSPIYPPFSLSEQQSTILFRTIDFAYTVR